MHRHVVAIAVLLSAVGCSSMGTSKDMWQTRLDYFLPTAEDHVGKAPIGAEEEVKSVEIHRDPTYSINVVQVNPGKEVKLHCHADHGEAIRIVRGSGMMIVDGRASAVGPGSYFVIPAGQDHGFKNSGSGVCIAITGYEPPFDGQDRIER
ncbi:MAG: cupin domain-containing protein [Planctomycetota bacterium]